MIGRSTLLELALVSSQNPTLLQWEMVLWTKLNFLDYRMLLWHCNLATFKTFCRHYMQKRMDTWMEMTNFTVVRVVLRNNYWSRNLIGPYCFWEISPRNSTLFTRPILTMRRTWAGHETKHLTCDTRPLLLTWAGWSLGKRLDRQS